MSVCQKCNHENPEGNKFCENCGAEIAETVFCPNCGFKTSAATALCPQCGAALFDAADEEIAKSRPSAQFPPRKQKPGKWLLWGGVGVVAVLAIVLVSLTLFKDGSGRSNKNYFLYFKENEMFLRNPSDDESAQITTRFISDLDEFQDVKSEIALAAPILGKLIYLSADGKTIVYPDRLSGDQDGVTIYVRETAGESDPIKIDSDITDYVVSETSGIITYLRADGSLYQNDWKTGGSKNKIAGNVLRFWMSKDGKRLIYVNEDDNLYLQTSGGEKEKLESDVGVYAYGLNSIEIDDACSTVWFFKNGNLYKRAVDGEREKIDSEVDEIIQVYETGELFYFKLEDSPLLSDFVIDDMKDADSAMSEPDEDDYSYYSAYDAWWEKQERDRLREELKENAIYTTLVSVYYYDGKNTVELAAGVIEESIVSSEETPVIGFSSYGENTYIKLSEIDITSVTRARSLITNSMNSNRTFYIGVKAVATQLELEDTNGSVTFSIDEDGSTVYVLNDSEGDLYMIPVKNDQPQQPVLYDTDVDMGFFVDKGVFLYWKDMDFNYTDGDLYFEGDLFMDKTRIAYDVLFTTGYDSIMIGLGSGSYVMNYDVGTETLFYFTDYNTDRMYGTLNVYAEGESKKVADDVYIAVFTSSGDLVYLSDYSQRSYTGDLFIYRNGKSEKLDTDVSALISLPDSDSIYRGGLY